MTTPWITLIAIAALGLIYVLIPIAASVFARYRLARTLRCPETGDPARVRIDARHAALTAIPGPPDLRIASCALWPERAGCAQRCLRASA
jgi:hypothetical protein